MLAFLLALFLNLPHLFAQSPNYNIGDVITNPDGSKGVVFWLAPDGSGGWMCALNDVSGTYKWSTQNVNISGFPALPAPTTNTWQANATVTADTAGYEHTQRLRAAGNASTYPAAYAVDFSHGWYLPAIGQLLKLYAQQATISAVLTANGGSEISRTNHYWSSTYATTSNAYDLHNPNGNYRTTSKSTAYYVRPVRSFSARAMVYDTTLTYQWSTGTTTPYAQVSPTASSTYTVTATSGFGCSNTAEVSVVVANGSSQNLYDTICAGSGPYELNGFNLSAAQTARAGDTVCTTTMSNGSCQTTITLRLHRKAPQTKTINASVCENGSYNLNGMDYWLAGTYEQILTAANGCDSVITLQLGISSFPEVSIQSTADTICQGESATLSVTLTSSDTSSSEHPMPPAIAVGDILCTDNSIVKPSDWPVAGKTAMGVVFYVDNTDQHGWAVALKEFSNVRWGPHTNAGLYTGTDNVSGIPDSQTERNAIGNESGQSNTNAIKNKYGNDFSNCQASYNSYYYDHTTGAVGNVNKGWYLPAAGQLRKLFSAVPRISNTLTLLDADAQLFNGRWYWSSTEASYGYTWCVYNTGAINDYAKYNSGSVRPIRSF